MDRRVKVSVTVSIHWSCSRELVSVIQRADRSGWTGGSKSLSLSVYIDPVHGSW